MVFESVAKEFCNVIWVANADLPQIKNCTGLVDFGDQITKIYQNPIE